MTGDRALGECCDRDWIWDRDAETATRAEDLKLAEDAWKRQLARLRSNSDFYAHKLEEGGIGQLPVSLLELGELPFTSKQELRQALDERPPFGSNSGVPADQIKRVYQTSGTTGKPSLIALSPEDIEGWTEIGVRSYYATGIHHHHSVISTYGAGPFVAGHTNFALSRIGCRVAPAGPGDTQPVLFAAGQGIVDTMLATASFAQYLANFFADPGSLPERWALRHIVTGGEPGGGIPAIRDHIQDRLQTTVTEVMGIGDVAPSLFGECPLQQGMHFCGAGYVWPELVDPDTRASIGIETGAVGELVYTHLRREAMPVVRYLSGDIVRIEGTSCECGRTGFRLRCIGRRDDMFIVRGVNVYPSAILGLLAEFRSQVTGRARVVRPAGQVSVEPPVLVEVEVAGSEDRGDLTARLEAVIRARLVFRARVKLVPEELFGASGYKTPLTVARP